MKLCITLVMPMEKLESASRHNFGPNIIAKNGVLWYDVVADNDKKITI